MVKELKLSEGLEAYRKKIEEILSWMPDWMHQDDFDKRAANMRPYVMPYSGETYILSPFAPWQATLHLLKLMEREGIIERKGVVNGEIYYRASTC